MKRGGDLRRARAGRRVRVRSLPARSEAAAAPGRPTVRALLELASAAGGDWSESIRRLVQCDAEMLHVERVTFWSLGEDAASLHCDAGYVVSSRSFERGATIFESDHGAYFEALRRARLLSIEDVHTDARTDELHDYAAIRGITSTLAVPVWVDGRLAGVLCHEHVGPRRAWTPWEEDFAMGAGQVVSSALTARAQTAAETAARRAAFLDSVSRLLLHSLDPREIARRIVDLVVPRFADFAMLWAQGPRGVRGPQASGPLLRGRPGAVAARGRRFSLRPRAHRAGAEGALRQARAPFGHGGSAHCCRQDVRNAGALRDRSPLSQRRPRARRGRRRARRGGPRERAPLRG